MTLVGNGLVPFRLVVFAQGVALSASLPGQGTFPAKDACLQIKYFKKDRSFPCRAECAYFAHSADNAFFVGRSQCVGQVELRNLTYDWYNYSQWKTTLPPQSQLN